MKTIGKSVANKIALLIVLVGLLGLGWWYLKNHNPFNGSAKTQYSFVVKKFSKDISFSSGADVETTQNQEFTNNELAKWPEWTKVVTKFFVGRSLTAKIPIKTEFKIELSSITRKDIEIKNNVLTFKEPLLVKVDSQQTGDIKIDQSTNGLVDKVVDGWTSGKEAQKFLSEKSTEAVYATSDYVLIMKNRKEKVAKYASQDLEDLLNLNSDKHLKVNMSKNDLNLLI
uniref:hypothetical protein n=1 Tax=Lactococcus lactis TaxID=1358 RepID=UPI0000061653|nr:hypothetical protein [Lactococcus lactis]CAD79464.1 hypothetical protein [Lactococcus lactis subsp. lactis bv. diacetylactis]